MGARGLNSHCFNARASFSLFEAESMTAAIRVGKEERERRAGRERRRMRATAERERADDGSAAKS